MIREGEVFYEDYEAIRGKGNKCLLQAMRETAAMILWETKAKNVSSQAKEREHLQS